MPTPIRTIVAGVARPAADDPALVAAIELARWTGAKLRLVHAFHLPPLFPSTGPELAYADVTERVYDGLVEALRAAARTHPGGESALCDAVLGTPGDEILGVARELGADLIVVGASRPGHAFLGTTAQRVLRGASAPVLVVRRPLHRPLERVLLTGDLSELSAAVHERGLDAVESLFGAPGAARSLLAVSFSLLPPPLPLDMLDRAARGELDDFLAARRPRERSVEGVVRIGDPAETIVSEAAAWDADLLVVGTHARGWAARLALGSVAEVALRDAPCNVLAIPPRKPAKAEARAELPAVEAVPALV